MAFSQADAANRLQFAYRYVSMQQVLTVPPTTADGDRGMKPKHGAPPILFCLPGTVLALALLNDVITFGVVKPDAFWHALIQTIMAFVLFLVIVHLTWHCHKLRNESKEIWKTYFSKIGAEPPSPSTS